MLARLSRLDRRPAIGITASVGRGRALTLMVRLAVHRAGGRGVVLRADRPRDPARLDGLIVGGGDDIGVDLYGGQLALDRRTDPERDAMELRLLEEAARRRLPVLGICRGAQMINVARGGTLHGDIHAAYRDLPRLRTVLPRKRVHIGGRSLLGRLLGVDLTYVNALHRQSVDRLGRGLAVVGRDEWGLVQAVEDPGEAFVLGVQWHPELLVSRGRQQRLFDGLVAAAAAPTPRAQTRAAEAEAAAP